MLSDPVFYAMAIPAVLFAGVSKGGFGSGAAFASTPFLALVLPPEVAVGLMLPLLMVMDVASLRAYWRRWDWRNGRAMMAWALPGVLLGAALFSMTDPDAVRFLIGAIALGFVAFQIARGRGWLASGARRFSPVSAGLSGIATGFTSFVSHAGGPPAAIHLLGQGLDKTTFQATTVLLFWWVNLVKLPFFAGLGLITAETLWACLILCPLALGGVVLGVRLHGAVPERPFFALIHVFLTVTGIKLIRDALG